MYSGCAKRKAKQKDLTMDQSWLYIIKKGTKRKIVTECKEIKLTDSFRVKHGCQLVVRQKDIENIIEFFHLFIFLISYIQARKVGLF